MKAVIKAGLHYTRIIMSILGLLLASVVYAYAEGLISVGEARKMLWENPKDLLVLDVRTKREFDAGHLPGAINMDFFGPLFEREVNALDRDRPIIIYCQTGRRSESATEIFKKAGFSKVSNLKGGFKAWKSAAYPVE